MSIKQSYLEQQLWYRIIKVVFSSLPFFVILALCLKGYIVFQGNLAHFWQLNHLHLYYLTGVAIGYFIIINIIWRIALYIKYGGLENDLIEKAKEEKQPSIPIAHARPVQSNGIWALVFTSLIVFILVYYFSSSAANPNSETQTNQGQQKPNTQTTTNNQNNTQCTPTGCGSLWYCSGYYYNNSVKVMVNGACFANGARPQDLYSGWSGSCRQCP